MARHRDDGTIRSDEASAYGAEADAGPILDRTDPLGLGGTPPPDAPSRSPAPRMLALLGEFFRMSRTTAILLGAFVVAGALYLLVRDEPVVAFGPQPGGGSTGTSEPTEPTEPADPSSTPAGEATGTTAPTSSSVPTGTSSRATGTGVPGGTSTTGPGVDGSPGGGADQSPPQRQEQQQPQQAPQQQPDQQSQSQPQRQQESPRVDATAVPGGVLEG